MTVSSHEVSYYGMVKKKAMTIDDLALMVKRGFDHMATKEDLKQFATKEDLRQFATKEDLKQFATKEDMHRLEQKMDAGFFAVNRRMDLLHEDISDLPDMRDKIRNLDRRMGRVEQKVGLAH